MNCLFVINDLAELEPTQTTALMIAKMAQRGRRVFVAGADCLSLDADNQIHARVNAVDAQGAPSSTRAEITLTAGDLVVVRTNPARGGLSAPIFATSLDLLAIAAVRGAVVINDADSLRRATSKLYSSRLPARLRPQMIVSRDPAAIRRFVENSEGLAVLKPLVGTRGTDVFQVRGNEPNLNQIIEVLTRGGLAMAQEFVPEAVDGDVRVLVLDGAALSVDGHVAAVRRVPASADFRSNVHLGATPRPADYTPALRRVVEAAAPLLAADGLDLCGLDIIGDKIVEINVFSAGGLGDASVFYGVDFIAPVLDFFERRLAQVNST